MTNRTPSQLQLIPQRHHKLSNVRQKKFFWFTRSIHPPTKYAQPMPSKSTTTPDTIFLQSQSTIKRSAPLIKSTYAPCPARPWSSPPAEPALGLFHAESGSNPAPAATLVDMGSVYANASKSSGAMSKTDSWEKDDGTGSDGSCENGSAGMRSSGYPCCGCWSGGC